MSRGPPETRPHCAQSGATDRQSRQLRVALAICPSAAYIAVMGSAQQVDGRHARRQRSREAVIDAVFSLVAEGKIPPGVDDVAERAGISVSSVFRNFDGLADLQRRALEEFHPRFAHLFAVEDADAPRAERIRSHVRARVELIGVASGLLRIARSRALGHETLVEGIANLRYQFAAQTKKRFAADLDQLTPIQAANLLAVIDATTSPEAFDVMSSAHARSARQITTTWNTALEALISHWTRDTNETT